MFDIRQYVVYIRLIINGKLMCIVVSTSQTISHIGLLTIIIPNECVSVADVLNDFEILFLCQFRSLIYVS